MKGSGQALNPKRPAVLGRLCDELMQVGMEIGECSHMRQEAILLERAAEIKRTMIDLWQGADKVELVYQF